MLSYIWRNQKVFGRKMVIKGILFDKDGTLIDFYEVWGTAVFPVMEKLLHKYGLSGVPGVREKMLKKLGIVDGKIDPEGALAWKPYNMIAEDLLNAMGNFDKKPDVKELTEELINGFYAEVCEKRQNYPTFTDLQILMKALSDMGIKVGLATTDELNSTKICMEKIGIAEKISFYGTAGGFLPVKPSGELIKEAAKLWNIEPSEIAVVGDTPNDMRFAHNGNALGIAVLSGVGKKEDLQPVADEIIASVDHLTALLKRINHADENSQGEKVWQRLN